MRHRSFHGRRSARGDTHAKSSLQGPTKRALASQWHPAIIRGDKAWLEFLLDSTKNMMPLTRAQATLARAGIKLLEAGAMSSAALVKGRDFFESFKTGINPVVQRIGSYFKFTIDVPGRVVGSFTRWVKVVDEKGRTIMLYHDTFDKTGKFINRSIKVPPPPRHVP